MGIGLPLQMFLAGYDARRGTASEETALPPVRTTRRRPRVRAGCRCAEVENFSRHVPMARHKLER